MWFILLLFDLQMCLAIGALVGVIAYRVSTLAALQLLDQGSYAQDNSSTIAETKHVITQNANIITTVTAACINVLIIIILNFVSTSCVAIYKF